MKLNTEAYIDLLGQLRMVAMNSKNIDQRSRMRDNMLRMAVRVFDATSACLCKHDFDRRETIVIGHYIKRRDTGLLLESDLTKVFPEQDMPEFKKWLYSDTPDAFVLKTADLDPDSVEYAEYAPHNIMAVIVAPIFFDDKLWGYLEIWDTKRNRDYTASQFEKLNRIAAAISDSILTHEG